MKGRLARQVVGVGVIASSIAGAAAAWVSGSMARNMVESNENARLLLVAADFRDEIIEELAEPLSDDSKEEQRHFRQAHGERTLGNIVIHELEELRYPEPRAVARYAHADQAGSPGLPMPAIGSCLTDEGQHLRACSVSLPDDGTLTLAIGTKQASSRDELFRGGILIGTVIGGVLGGILSFFLGRWTLLPLGDLRRRVRQVRTHDPSREVLDDVSPYPEELEELRLAIAELVSRLGEALLQAQSFATQAAHELRTPLAALSGELELLIEDVEHPEELLRMKMQLDRLTTLIQRMLVLASSAESMGQVGQTIDCVDIVNAIVASLPADRRERVQVRQDEDLLVRGDEELLRVLVNNAVDNALKFSKDEITVCAGRESDYIWIEVRDSGVGIAENERLQVFSPFYRGKAARGTGVSGHGIGLALIAHVARIHGGQAQFVEQEQGCLLRVELPVWRGAA